VVTHWVNGRNKIFTGIIEPEWHALGAELAALHLRLDTFTTPLPRLTEQVVDVAAERARIGADRTRAPAYAHYLDARRDLLDRFAPAALAPPPVPERPIHNDYNQHNYLFDDTMPPTILDWEGAIAAPREYEVVRCMNHLPLVARPHASAFVTGYRSVRALDPASLRWAVDRAFIEHAIKSWPLDRLLAGLPGAEERLAGSVEVTLALHARIGELDAFYGVAR
jgi:Ser/Thr protein kinase RdoA (MazF antagonist)